MIFEAIMSGLCFLTIAGGASWLGGLAVFAPLNERTLLFQVRSRFRIADLISLAILLQVGVGTVLAIAQPRWETRMVLAFIVSSIVIIWWVIGLRMLSKAGVENGLHRTLFLTVHLPLGYLSVVGLLASVLMAPAGLSFIFDSDSWTTFSLGIVFVVLPILFVFIAYRINRVCRAMADRARDEQAIKEGIEFDNLSETPQLDPKVARYVTAKRLHSESGDPVAAAAAEDNDDIVILNESSTPSVDLLTEDGPPATGPADPDA